MNQSKFPMKKINSVPIGKKGGVIVRMGQKMAGNVNKAKNAITEESSATLPLIQEGAEISSPPQLMSYREGEEDNFFNEDSNGLNNI
jgi:hypothetical protein